MPRRAFLAGAAGLAAPLLLQGAGSTCAGAPDGAPDFADLRNLHDVEEAARPQLGASAYDYYASGAGDELTLRWNLERLQQLRLRPRVLRDVSTLDPSIELFGRRHPLPILLAPTANHRLAHPRAERETAAGAALAGVGLVLSNGANTAIGDVAQALGAAPDLWFQLYVQPDRGLTREIVEHARAGGARVLCVTVDSPVDGPRNRQARSGWTLPLGTEHPNYLGRKQRRALVSLDEVRPARLTWDDVSWLRSFAGLPIVLKGILHPADAELAVAHGAAGVIVSNHGGRVLDTAPASIDALPGVVDQVAGRVPVLFDSGIRRGSDIVKAIAHGARAVLVGRPYIYGLAVGGAAGLAHVIRVLRQELLLTLALTGRRTVMELDRTALWP